MLAQNYKLKKRDERTIFEIMQDYSILLTYELAIIFFDYFFNVRLFSALINLRGILFSSVRIPLLCRPHPPAHCNVDLSPVFPFSLPEYTHIHPGNSFSDKN